MHLKRWLTAIVGLPLLFLLVGPGPRWLLHCFILFLAIAGLIEFYRMSPSRIPQFIRILSYIVTTSLFIALYFRQIALVPFIVVMWAFFPLIFYLFTRPNPQQQWTDDISRIVLGQVYIGLPLAMLVCIDLYPKGDGKMWIFFLLVVIFASDTGAYYAGKYLGKHKLYEAISPNKTWEGAIGGLLLSLIISNLYLRIFPFHPLNLEIIILVLVMAIMGQIGDLVESMLKRNQGLKDSGSLLPGHGGILDRIDGLLFAIPLLYLYLYGLVL